MTDSTYAAAQQLTAAMAQRVAALTTLIPTTALDEQAISAGAHTATARLAGYPDDPEAALETAQHVMQLLWPNAAPEKDGQVHWWRSPLGLLCARATAGHDNTRVSQGTAAAILNRAPGTMSALRARGALTRHPDGGFTRGSVLARLVRHHNLASSARQG